MQISEMLIRDIASGRLRDGMRLPPEREHCVQLGISIGTLRKALHELEARNLLTRVQGSGNYIQCQGDVSSLYSMFRLELHEGGGLPRADLLSVTLADKPGWLPRIGTSDRGWRFRRLRFLSDSPAALEEIWIDSRMAGSINPAEVSESLYLFYRETLGMQVIAAEDRISAAPVPEWADSRFGLRAGEVSGFVERIGRNQHGADMEASRTWFDQRVVHYVSRLGKL